GALLTIVGVVVFGPAVAGPIGNAIGVPLARLRGVTGALARGNATRNPRRTWATAVALRVGVAVVTVVMTFGSSITAAIDQEVANAVPVKFADGTTTPFTVGAVYNSGDVAGDVVMTRAAWAPHALQEMDRSVLIKLKSGVALATGKAAVERVAAPYGGPSVQDRTEFAASVSQG